MSVEPSSKPEPTPRLTDEELGMEFPCVFAIKAMGRDQENFSDLVLELLGSHTSVENAIVQQRPSNSGKYLSVTVSVETTSREHLDKMYQTLNGHERVLMTL